MAIDYSSLDQARATAEGAQKTALDYGARGLTLPDELRKALGERYAGSGMAQDAATARTEFMASAPQARADVAGLVSAGNILSPTQQQAILAAKRGAALVPLIASNINQEAAFGNIDDLVGAGTRAFQAQTAQQQGVAQLAQSSYSNLLSELFKRAEEERTQELFPLQKQKLQADITNSGTTSTQKYPFSEPWISAGLAGQPVSKIGNKVGAEYQKQLNEQQARDKRLGTQKQQLEAETLKQELEAKKKYDEANWFKRMFMTNPY